MKEKNHSNTTLPCFRQGDVLLQVTEQLPSNATPISPKNGKLILAEGEATGHSHTIDHSDALHPFETDSGELFFEVKDVDVKVNHQEHDSISLPPGKYQVVRQREYADAASLLTDRSSIGVRSAGEDEETGIESRVFTKRIVEFPFVRD